MTAINYSLTIIGIILMAAESESFLIPLFGLVCFVFGVWPAILKTSD